MASIKNVITQQVDLCLDKCPHNELECYEKNRVGDVTWLEQRGVIHACSDGSQWSYTAKEGVQEVSCPLLESLVQVRFFQVSCEARILVWKNVNLNFIDKPYVEVKYHADRVLRMRRPMFGLYVVEKSWDAVTALIEAQLEEREPLEEFVDHDGPE